MNKKLPIFAQDPKTLEILKEAKSAIPKNTKVYLVGGAARNALYFKLFKEELPQRDYDILLVGDKDAFVKNLRARGFVYGKIRKKHEITLKKKKISKPQHQFKDYVFLDMHIADEKSILKNLEDNANFTINGFALSLKDINSENWHKKVVSLPCALQDLKNKQLRVNVIKHPANLFACLRFMSKGFKPPSKKEVKELLSALGSLEVWRYERNIKKLFNYVGGEKEARRLIKKLGIKEDVFDFEVIKKLC
ncbi:MAG: hypothetical protein V1688_04875 [bacterium]